MMIAPVIFCTIVLGVGSIAKAATVGKVGGLALGYFIAMSTFALAIGLVVGNLIHPGEGLMIDSTGYEAPAAEEAGGTAGFLLGIIPETLVSSLTSGSILQTLFVALLVGFALQRMGDRGATILFSTHVMAHAERLCDRLSIIAGGKVRFEGTVADARATLPFKAHYTPHHDVAGAGALLPADAEREDNGWRFTMPSEGIEALLVRLIDAGHGISGLSIERPGLHDAFVRIVGEQALEDAA
jgi:hypothetical protein